MPNADRQARIAWSSNATGAPNNAMIPSPVNLSTVPPYRCTTRLALSTSSAMISRSRSVPTVAAISIECTTSANSTVTCLYSAVAAPEVIGEPHASQNRASWRASRPHAGQAIAAPTVTSISWHLTGLDSRKAQLGVIATVAVDACLPDRPRVRFAEVSRSRGDSVDCGVPLLSGSALIQHRAGGVSLGDQRLPRNMARIVDPGLGKIFPEVGVLRAQGRIGLGHGAQHQDQPNRERRERCYAPHQLPPRRLNADVTPVSGIRGRFADARVSGTRYTRTHVRYSCSGRPAGRRIGARRAHRRAGADQVRGSRRAGSGGGGAG